MAEGECRPLYTVDRCRAVYCRPLYTAVELYTSASGAGRCVYAVYRYTAGIHHDLSTAQNTAFYSIWPCDHRGDDGGHGPLRCLMGHNGVPMTAHVSQLVRSTQ